MINDKKKDEWIIFFFRCTARDQVFFKLENKTGPCIPYPGRFRDRRFLGISSDILGRNRDIS